MTRLSDVIEDFIKQLICDNKEGDLQIQRNELATHFSCAPSQINYVLTTRFSTDKGYYVESRRGGGGYIVIRRVVYEENQSLVDILKEKIGNSITYEAGKNILSYLADSSIITQREGEIVKIAINDRTLNASCENRNKLRADILKSIIMVILI